MLLNGFFFSRCLILRANGELSLLDLDHGRERELTNSVELFWVTSGQSEEKTNLIEEVSWLDYGFRGMQVNLLFSSPFLIHIQLSFVLFLLLRYLWFSVILLLS